MSTTHTHLAPPAPAPDAGAHAAHMDRIYRLTRHIYDATRKFFLLGRDELLRSVPEDAGTVLEMGCGTARNLIKLAAIRPAARLFGLDASKAMLATADSKVNAAGLRARISLRHALAEQLDHHALFGLDRPFDVALFPYSLSMMPGWQAALAAAIANVRPGGEVLIVDFWDQDSWPGPLRRLLVWWLSLFSVHFRPELLDHLRELERAGQVRLEIRGVRGRYAYIARLIRTA